MPRGITYMNTIRKMPKMAQGAALEMSWAQLGTNWMNSAPKIAPEIVASPPITMPVRKRDRQEDVEGVGRDERDGHGGERARDARVGRAHAEDGRLVERAVDAHGLGGDVVVADGHDGPPDAAAQEVPGQDEQDDGDGEGDEVEPLVLGEPEAEGRLGLADSTMPCEPPVQCSKYFKICGTARASAKVASAR